jgi:hypothetical protein
LVEESRGEEAGAEVGAVAAPNGTETWCKGEAGRLLPALDNEELLYRVPRGEGWNGVVRGTPLLARGVRSSSASSEMSHTLGAPECAYDSSATRKGLLVRFGERRGDEGRAMGTGEGERARWPLGLMTVGSE